MKEIGLSLLGILAILWSCSREIEPVPTTPDSDNVEETGLDKTILPANIPSTLIATFGDEGETKTAYEGQKSKWVMGDQVCLLYVNNLAAPTHQGWIAYKVTGLDNDDRMATFTIMDGQTSRAAALSEYQSTGVAYYPYKMSRPKPSQTTTYIEAINSNYGGMPFITIPDTQTGNYEDVIMLGKTAVVDNDVLTVDFKNAVSILKVTVTGIPAEAAKFQFVSSDASYRPSGDFPIDISADAPLEINKTDYRKYESGGSYYFSGNQAITVNRTSDWDDGSQDFYFNVPTGDYTAGSITLKLLDNGNNVLLEKPIKSDFTFVRNKMITGISLANEWITLGTGKYIDNFVWGGLINKGTVNADTPGFVDVVIQKNAADNNQYRVVNPYGVAAEQFGITGSLDGTPDPYLIFTISSGAVTIETHKTGMVMEYKASEFKATNLQDGGSGKSLRLTGDDANPGIVQIAPVYKAADNSSGNVYSKGGTGGLIQIIFPSAIETYSTYLPSITNLGFDASNVLSSFGLTIAGNRTRLVLDRKNAYQLVRNGEVDSAGKEKANYTSNQSGLNWTSKIDESGIWYLNWYVCDNDNNYFRQGYVRFYALTSTDFDALNKDLTVSLSSTATASALKLDITKGSDVDEVRAIVTGHSQADAIVGLDNNTTGVAVFNSAGTNLSLAVPESLESGKYTIYARGYKQYGTELVPIANTSISNVYYLSATDKAKLCKELTMNYTQGNGGALKYGTMTLVESNDCSKGQIILSDFDGMTSSSATSRLCNDHTLFKLMKSNGVYWLGGVTGQPYEFTSSSDKVYDGNIYYGILSNGQLIFNAVSNPLFKYSVSGTSTQTADVYLFSDNSSGSSTISALTFNYNGSTLTVANNYVVIRWNGYYYNGSNIAQSAASGGYASNVSINL